MGAATGIITTFPRQFIVAQLLFLGVTYQDLVKDTILMSTPSS